MEDTMAISIIITTYAPRDGELPQIRVKSLKNEDFRLAARALGGTWDGSWWFKDTPLTDVQGAALAAYGTTGPTGQDITDLYEAIDTACHRAADAAAPYLDQPIPREDDGDPTGWGWERAARARTNLQPHPGGSDHRYVAVRHVLETLAGRAPLTEHSYRRHLRVRPGLSEQQKALSAAKADELLYDAARALETALAELAGVDKA